MTADGASRRVLVQFAHPALERSRINRRVMDAIAAVPGVTVNDLYERYPDFLIDVDREQALLREHGVLMFQFPLYWYSTPAILKEWQDLVLEHGFAYGRGGDALHGKVFFCAATTAGTFESYTHAGANHITLRELLAPLEHTALVCGMECLPPLAVHDSRRADVGGAVERFTERFRRLVAYLARPDADLAPIRVLPELNLAELPPAS